MRAESSALLAAAAAQVEARRPALTRARPELCTARPAIAPHATPSRLQPYMDMRHGHEVVYSQVEAQQGGMAEQRDRLHALLASQAVEKEALEKEALASAAERAGLASQLLELQVGCNPMWYEGRIPVC